MRTKFVVVIVVLLLTAAMTACSQRSAEDLSGYLTMWADDVPGGEWSGVLYSTTDHPWEYTLTQLTGTQGMLLDGVSQAVDITLDENEAPQVVGSAEVSGVRDSDVSEVRVQSARFLPGVVPAPLRGGPAPDVPATEPQQEWSVEGSVWFSAIDGASSTGWATMSSASMVGEEEWNEETVAYAVVTPDTKVTSYDGRPWASNERANRVPIYSRAQFELRNGVVYATEIQILEPR